MDRSASAYTLALRTAVMVGENCELDAAQELLGVQPLLADEPQGGRVQPGYNLVRALRLVYPLARPAPPPRQEHLLLQGGARQVAEEGSATHGPHRRRSRRRQCRRSSPAQDGCSSGPAASNLLAACPPRRERLPFGASPTRFHLPDHFGPHGQSSHHSPRHLVRPEGSLRLDHQGEPLPRR